MPKERPTIFFTHANGFPSPCYQQFFKHLSDEYEVKSLDIAGHDPRYPVTNNWPYLVEEVIHAIKTQHSRPVIGVGHSLGGALLTLASMQYPALFQSVVMLDTPLYGALHRQIVKVAKCLGVFERFTPAKRVKTRRTQWPNKESAYKHLRNKSLFKNFTEACFDDYLERGMKPVGDGIGLVFNREIEYQIYITMPDIPIILGRKYSVPLSLIYALDNIPGCCDVRKRLALNLYPFEGGHLFPFEKPKEAATLVKAIIRNHQ